MKASHASAQHFVDGLELQQVRYQHCLDCASVMTLARLCCSHCGSERLSWSSSRGQGTVYAVTVVSRAPSDEFRALAPYCLALVDLDEGSRLMGHIHANAVIGSRVKAGFFEHAGRTLIRFEALSAI